MFFAAFSASAQSPSSAFMASGIGFVNTQRILQDSVPARDDAEKLRREFLPRSEKIRAMVRQLNSLKESLQENSLVMSDDERSAEQAHIAELSQKIQDAQQNFNDDLDRERNADIERLLNRANAVVDSIARKRHLAIIFQNAVYVAPAIDITPKVMQVLAKPNAVLTAP
jgi:outer membrane protein